MQLRYKKTQVKRELYYFLIRDRLKLQTYAIFLELHGFASGEELLAFYNNFGKNYSVLALTFHQIEPNSIPKQLNYSIRSHFKGIEWNTHDLFEHFDEYIPDKGKFYYSIKHYSCFLKTCSLLGSDMYIHKGFMALQWALDESFIEFTTGRSELPFYLTIQELPYPPYVKDEGLTLVSLILPIFTFLSFLLICPDILKRIVEEKSSGLKVIFIFTFTPLYFCKGIFIQKMFVL